MMTPGLEHAKRVIGERVELFARNLDQYRAPDYKEAQLRVEFLDPFFEALGWDVANRQGWAEQYKEVINEDALKASGATRAPDYSFRIGGVRKFFVEAKKPARLIKADASSAYQLKRYAWSAKLPVSVLTDFEEFAVYDCRQRPSDNDAASRGRINFYSFEQYVDRLPEIYDVFSKEAVLRGSFDRFLQEAKAKRGTTPVDAEFLKEIEGWRTILAKNIAQLNPRLGPDELSDAVQRTIDRIIFLRMAEDRGTEEYGQLQRLSKRSKMYTGLVDLYHQADVKYNSGLFDFAADPLALRLKIDDDKLGGILDDLYYPKSPYEFSVLGADTLGNVYEQFLGKVIRLTPAHLAKVEEKPEVKKAGGVYYTPTYIVDYIVKQTVGKLIEGKAPSEVETLRVLDPACGSGSFLLGAYQLLLDHHLAWYAAHQGEPGVRERIYEGVTGWRMTTAEKKRILLNNIYGVDIDRQAVEVTKLSLLLKVLEGENQETLGKQLALFRERALPNLDSNIKWGNSLIGPDYFAGKMFPDPEELKRVKPFDWSGPQGFPEIMKAGGFDCVIGNPPYGAYFRDKEASYFRDKFPVFRGVADIYTCFIESSLGKLTQGGYLSFIVPSAWLGGPGYLPLREFLLTVQVEKILLLPFDTFSEAYVDTAIFVVSNREPPLERLVQTYTYPKRQKLTTIALSNADYRCVSQSSWENGQGKRFILEPGTIQLLDRVKQNSASTFADSVTMRRGVLFDRDLLSPRRTSPKSFRYFEGDVYRYQLNFISTGWVEFNDQMRERPKEFCWFEGPRILLRRLVNRRQRLMATLTSATFITDKNLYSLLLKESELSHFAVLGILNSHLISHLYLNQVTQATKDDFPQVTIKDILALPFPSFDKSSHDRMVALVEQMLELHKRLAAAKSQTERDLYQRQIDGTDKEIDALVYRLYGLTEEEIKIVENQTETPTLTSA